MNIAIFGYYNFFNAGDDRIQHCLKRIFAGHIITFFPHFLPPPHLDYLNTFDWIIIGGGGLVRERVGIWVEMSQWLRGLRANVGVVGLGVNSLTPELTSEVFSLLDYAQFFFVRDRKSKQLLNNDVRVKVHPDLTWCFPFEPNSETVQDTIALNITGCEGKFQTDRWLKQLELEQISPFPLYFTKDRDYALLTKHFGEVVPREFTLEPLINSKMLIACRYHAIVFAMQLGKPFIAINYDDKVKRLLVESGLSNICLELDQSDLLREKIKYLQAHESEIKDKVKSYAQEQIELAQIMLNKLHRHINHTPLVEHPRTVIKRRIKKILHLT